MRNNAKSLRGDGYADEESEGGYIWDYMILDEVDIFIRYLILRCILFSPAQIMETLVVM